MSEQAQLQIPLTFLREASALLLDYLENVVGDTVSLDKDFFWSIDPDQLYDLNVEPSTLTVGQLSESAENLERLVADPSRSTAFALVWLADLLRAAGHTVVR